MGATAKIAVGAAEVVAGVVLIATGYGAAAGAPLILGGLGTLGVGIAEEFAPTAQRAGGGRGPDTTQDSSIPPELIVYGRCLVPQQTVFRRRHRDQIHGQPDREFSNYVDVITRGRKCHALVGVMLGPDLVMLEANNGAISWCPDDALIPVSGSKYRGYYAAFFKSGDTSDPSQPFPWLASRVAAWDSDRRLTRICAVHSCYRFNVNFWPFSPPETKYLIEGFEVYDPRTATTGWSENAALCAADAYTGRHGPWGGIPYSWINEAVLIGSANVCDETLTKADSTTVSRYVCSYCADASIDFDRLVGDLIAAMAGTSVYGPAGIELYAGATMPNEIDFSSADYAGGVTIDTEVQIEDLKNEVHAVYADIRNNYKNNTTPCWPKNPATHAWRAEDNGAVAVQELQLPAVYLSEQAQRIQKIWIENHRRNRNFSVPMKQRGLLLKPMTVFAHTDELPQWSGKLFQARLVGEQQNGTVSVRAKEYSDDIFAWTSSDEQIEAEPGANAPPVLADDSVATSKDIAVTCNVLANDEGPGPLTITAVSTPSHGTADISDDAQSIGYTPATGYTGTDSFTYTAANSDGSATANVSILVASDAGVTAIDDTFTITDDAGHLLDVLANDVPAATVKTITAVGTALHAASGFPTIVSNKVKYKRFAGYIGTDSFTYDISGGAGTDTGTVNIISTGGVVGGDNPSGLAWASGMCGEADSGTPSDADDWGTWRGRAVDIVNLRSNRHAGWTEIISSISGSTYTDAKNKGYRVEQVVPLFPDDATLGTYATKFAAAADGAYDTHHQDIADHINGLDHLDSLIIRLGHEADSPSQNDGWIHDPSPARRDYRAAWRRAAAIYKATISNVLLDWNNTQRPSADPRTAYPGDDVVDIIGVDAYGNHNSFYPQTMAEFLTYANKTDAGGWPLGPRAWALLAKSHSKPFGLGEWGVVHPDSIPEADNPIYIEGMWNLFKEAAGWGLMAYEVYFNTFDSRTGDHRLHVSGNNNPLSTTKYLNLWTPPP